VAFLFATLGYTPQLVLAPLRGQPAYEAVHVFYGPGPKDAEEALTKVRTACKALGVKLVVHKVADPFDYTAFLHAFNQALKELGQVEVHVNASGGTRVGIMASTIFCFTQDIPLLYFDEYGTKEGKTIPLRAFRNLDRIGDKPRAILRRLQKRGPADMGTLATEMSLAPSTLTEHVATLLEAGTVLVDREGKRRIVALVPDLAKIDFGVMG
jgi:DNA-binding transcriptional ArsR family regulator